MSARHPTAKKADFIFTDTAKMYEALDAGARGMVRDTHGPWVEIRTESEPGEPARKIAQVRLAGAEIALLTATENGTGGTLAFESHHEDASTFLRKVMLAAHECGGEEVPPASRTL